MKRYLVVLSVVSATFGASQAMATDLICEGSASETNYPGGTLPVAGQPTPPATLTQYRLVLSMADVGTSSPKLNASLTTSVTAPNGGTQVSVSPTASLKAGVAGVRAVRSNGQTLLFNANGIWVINVDEAVAQENAGRPNLIQVFVNSGNLSASVPAGVRDIDHVFCVAF